MINFNRAIVIEQEELLWFRSFGPGNIFRF
jgi:hypothetical protein